MPAPRILVIAYGNPLRCDDGLAWRAAEKLSVQNLPSDVEIVTCHQLTPELALPVSQARTVLFVDATRGSTPGKITTGRIRPGHSASVFTHDFSPSTILRLAEELYGGYPEALAVSLCGECFDHGVTLSAKVEESLSDLVDQLRELIQAANTSTLPL